MSFLWPTTLNSDPGVLGRAGRVLHWTGLILAAPWVALGVGLAFQDNGWNNLGLALVGVPFALGGRGLRYILAGE